MPIVTEVELLKYRRTKIIATVGPASNSPPLIRALIEAGVNVFRLNMSHGTHDEHGAAIAMIRKVADELGSATALLADLCGPKIRTGKFSAGMVELEAGREVVITTQGRTAATISVARPAAPVVAISNDRRTCRRINLMWGMIPHFAAGAGSENPNQLARRCACDLGLASTGDFIVMVRGFYADPQLNSPSITLLQV